ncbi:MAG: response regulator [Kiritimatiellae bacterium]|nr:response regulator [Kiritimatiellia bacterium]
MKTTHRVLLADREAADRKAIRRLMEAESGLRVCGEVSSCEQLFRALRTLRPDLLLLDLTVGGEAGAEFIREIRRQVEDVLVLVLTEREESLFAESALRAGANGYVMKSEASKLLPVAVRSVLAGNVFVSSAVQQAIFNRLRGMEQEQGTGAVRRSVGGRTIKPRSRRAKARS